jgi:hypothetical protein
MWVTLTGGPTWIEAVTGIFVLQLRSWKENVNNFRKGKGLALQCPMGLPVNVQLQSLLSFDSRWSQALAALPPEEGTAGV